MTTPTTPEKPSPPPADGAPVTGTKTAPVASQTVSETAVPAIALLPDPVGKDVPVVSAVASGVLLTDAPQSEDGTIIAGLSNAPGVGATTDGRVTLLPVTTSSYHGMTEGQTVMSDGGKATAVLHVVHNNNPGTVTGQVQVADDPAGPWRQAANFALKVEGDKVELDVPAGAARVVFTTDGSVTLSIG